MLARVPGVIAVQGDLRKPEEVLGSPEVAEVIDFDQPVAVLLIGALPFVDDAEDQYAVVATFRDTIAPGSYIVIGHAGATGSDPAAMERAQQAFSRTPTGPIPGRARPSSACSPGSNCSSPASS